MIFHQGRILACQRAVEKSEGGRWEFPGGKVEAGESDHVALAREIEEELAMSVSPGVMVKMVAHGKIELWAYECCWDGIGMEVREHQEIRWVQPDKGDTLDWAPADVDDLGSCQEDLFSHSLSLRAMVAAAVSADFLLGPSPVPSSWFIHLTEATKVRE